MPRKLWLPIWLTLACVGCGSTEPPAAEGPPANSERRESVFDPLTGTIERAEGVQTTVDDRAAELRRRVEQAEQ